MLNNKNPARLLLLALLFFTVGIHYRDAALWRPLYFSFFLSPVLLSVYSMVLGAVLAFVFCYFGKRKLPPFPGLETLWFILAAGATGAHSLAVLPQAFNIHVIGFPPGLDLLILTLETVAVCCLLMFSHAKNRTLVAACSLTALTTFAAVFHIQADQDLVGGAMLGAPHFLILACASIGLLVSLEESGKRFFNRTFSSLIIGFLILGFFSTVFAQDKDHSFTLLLHTAAGAAMMLNVAAACAKQGVRPLLLVFVITSGLFLTLTAILSGAFAMEHVPAALFLKSQIHIFNTHPNITSLFLALSSLACLALGFRNKNKLALLGAVVFLCALIATHSRAGILGFAAGAALFVGFLLLIKWKLTRLQRIVAAVIPAASALLFILCLFSAQISEQFRGTINAHTIDFRTTLWSAAYSTVEQNPVLGVGLGDYTNHSRFIKGRHKKLPYNLHPHSLTLNMAEGMGIPAVLVMGLLIFLFLRRAFLLSLATDAPSRARLYGLLCAGALIGLQVANIFDQLPDTMIPDPMWLFWGVIAGLSWERAAKHRARAYKWALIPLAIVGALIPALAAHLLFKASADLSGSPQSRIQRIKHFKMLKPFNRRIQFALSDAYLKDGQLDMAIQTLKEAEASKLYNANYWSLLGKLYLKANKNPEAAIAFKNANEIDSTSAYAPQHYLSVIKTSVDQNKLMVLDEQVRGFFTYFPEEAVTTLRGHPEIINKMLHRYKIQIEADPEKNLYALTNRMLGLIYGGDSIQVKDDALDCDRHISAAMAYKSLDRSEQGIDLIQRCLSGSDIRLPRLRQTLGWLYYNANRTEDAVNEMKKLMDDPRMSAKAANTIGWMMMQSGRHKEALKFLETQAPHAYDIHFKSRDNMELNFNLARGYYSLNQFDIAMAKARKALFFAPETGFNEYKHEAWLVLVNSLKRTGRIDELVRIICENIRILSSAFEKNQDQLERFRLFAEKAAAFVKPGRRIRLDMDEVVSMAHSYLPDNLGRVLFLALFYDALKLRDEAKRLLIGVKNRFNGVPIYEEALNSF